MFYECERRESKEDNFFHIHYVFSSFGSHRALKSFDGMPKLTIDEVPAVDKTNAIMLR